MTTKADNSTLKRQIRTALDKHALGAARFVEEGGDVKIFLEQDPSSTLSTHVAMSDLEQAIGRPVRISSSSELTPAQRVQLVNATQVV
jgi:hypothetical protein